jgi:hypothetical protein
MTKILTAVVVVASTLALASTAFAGARANTYYTVFCDDIAYESVDAHAVEQGGKAAAVAKFPQGECELRGPFRSS